jgi:carbamoyl-phosphate synthase L subunit-like protein
MRDAASRIALANQKRAQDSRAARFSKLDNIVRTRRRNPLPPNARLAPTFAILQESAQKGSPLLKPTVLMVTTSRWFPTARLAVALANAGCAVEAVCPSGHPIGKTSAVTRTFPFRGLAPLRLIAAAIAATKPDLLVSGDDLATSHLHTLYRQQQLAGSPDASLCALIERSLGAANHFAIVDDRAAFMAAAQEAGVRVPKTVLLAEADQLPAAQLGFPVVLKANGTSGGVGVRVAQSTAEAQRAFHALQAPPLLARAVKRALFDRDASLLRPSLLRTKSTVTAQSFIPGREATSALACWQGEVLASTHFEVLQKAESAGHATVVRRIDHPEMSASTQKMVRRLQLSGFHGFDFMLDAQSRDAYMIEINPRATQVGHLAFGPAHDLPTAIVSALTGAAIPAPPRISENDVIALFPQECLRDPHSAFLVTGYHDVPWDQPQLMRACLRNAGTFGAELLAKLPSA